MDNIESKVPETVSYYDHQEQLAREERHTNRWRIFAWIIFAVLIISNVCWIYYESQFIDSITVTQDTPNGNNSYIGHDGSITNGSADSN